MLPKRVVPTMRPFRASRVANGRRHGATLVLERGGHVGLELPAVRGTGVRPNVSRGPSMTAWSPSRCSGPERLEPDVLALQDDGGDGFHRTSLSRRRTERAAQS